MAKFLLFEVQDQTRKGLSQQNLYLKERLKELKLPSMEYRSKQGDMIQCYNIMNGLVRLEVSDLFTPSTSVKTRGHHQKVRRERSQKGARTKSFFQRTANSQNSLPKHVIDAPSVDSFKNRLDEAWESKWYKSQWQYKESTSTGFGLSSDHRGLLEQQVILPQYSQILPRFSLMFGGGS